MLLILHWTQVLLFSLLGTLAVADVSLRYEQDGVLNDWKLSKMQERTDIVFSGTWCI